MHIYKTRIKIILRNRSLIFWTLLFPLVLGTLFNLAFSNLSSAENFNPIKVGIVNDENYNQLIGFKDTIESISEPNEDQVLEASYYNSIDETNEALSNNDIVGYYIVNDSIDIVVKSNGTEQTIMKYISDTYQQNYLVINNIVNNTGEFKDSMLAELNSEASYFESKKVGNLDLTVVYFYTLIGMVCLYGGFFGINATNETEANLTKKAARLCVAPTNKLKSLIYSLLAGFTIQLIEISILLVYLICFLNVDFGNQLGYVLLMSFVGSFAGISMGTLIGVSNKLNENFKTGLVIGITMFCSFLSGMMINSIKYLIHKYIPILGMINPVNMITDGLYSLYYYDNLDRYFYNIISLIIFSIIMLISAYLFARRKKYDSI